MEKIIKRCPSLVRLSHADLELYLENEEVLTATFS